MKKIFLFFRAIAKLINFTRLLLINLLFLCLIALFFVVINLDDEKVKVAKGSTLHLNFAGSIVEQKKPLNYSNQISKELFSANQPQVNEYQVDQVIQSIRYAQHDPRVRNILLELNNLTSASLNHILDIGNALNKFKEEGKTVTAIADNYSQTEYLLASYADNIYLNPQGVVFLQGFSVYRLYFKEALDKLLITPHIFKVGTYKSFVEPFIQNEMSDASKEANSHWLNQLWENYIDAVIAQRKDNAQITRESISPTLAQLKTSLQTANGDTALYAKQAGLVDELKYRFEIIDQLDQQAKSASVNFNLLSYEQYLSTLPPLYRTQKTSPQIALIHGTGEILAGEQSVNAIGGDSFSRLLANALHDQQVKAVVIRLDTPGGSAFASEKIRQQILALKKAGKKVVVSMASVTASGGYWIASAADSIIASPTTLTGSIGIFGMYASADKALNKLGIYNDGVGTTGLSTLTPTRALEPELSEIIQLGIEHGYQQFLTIVSQGRNMSLAEVDEVAQGRVWTGVDALKLGLVDQLGGLNDAFTEAAKLASLSQYNIRQIGPKLSTRQQMLNELFGFGIKIFDQTLGIDPALFEILDSVQEQAGLLTRFNDPQGRYAYCAMCQVK